MGPAVAARAWPNWRSLLLAGGVLATAAVFHLIGRHASPVAVSLFVLFVISGYAVSSSTGAALLALSSAAYLSLRTFDAGSPSAPVTTLADPETWAPIAILTLVSVLSDAYRRKLAKQHVHLEQAEEARAAAERRAAEAARLSRSLGAVAGGLLGAFEPDRMLRRFTALVRTLLGAEAALTLAADESRNTFQILEASGTGEESLAELRQIFFPLGNISRDGITTLSFLAGDAGLLAPVMRNRFQAVVGFAAPILRGKQLAGALLIGYRQADKTLLDVDRSLLAGSAAFCATLFESVRLDKELRSSNRIKADFVSTVSHELRTPLNAINGYCDLLRDETMGPINDEQRDTLGRLKQYSVQLAELIEAVLDVDRLESGYLSMNWAECDLGAFFQDLREGIPRHWLKPEVEIRWLGTAARNVRTDPEKLRLLLRNLVHNALKFTPAGSVTVEMSVTPGTLLFTVSDTGVGIPPEIRASLFQMFQPGDRADTRTRGGLGLGLFLADRMVKALWGQISVDSTPGAGTTVRVILPIEEPITDTVVEGE